jgi:hypothetical protein
MLEKWEKEFAGWRNGRNNSRDGEMEEKIRRSRKANENLSFVPNIGY